MFSFFYSENQPRLDCCVGFPIQHLEQSISGKQFDDCDKGKQ